MAGCFIVCLMHTCTSAGVCSFMPVSKSMKLHETLHRALHGPEREVFRRSSILVTSVRGPISGVFRRALGQLNSRQFSCFPLPLHLSFLILDMSITSITIVYHKNLNTVLFAGGPGSASQVNLDFLNCLLKLLFLVKYSILSCLHKQMVWKKPGKPEKIKPNKVIQLFNSCVLCSTILVRVFIF